MFVKLLLFLFLVALIVVACALKERFKTEQKQIDCICAFDLDDTLTCGLDRAANAINTCKIKGCKIAINTARPSKWYSDINLAALGLKEDDFDDDFYHGEAYKCSFGDDKCLEDTIADTKVKHLQTLAIKWNVKPQRIILFDDQYYNIEKAKMAGFSTILANHHACGLPDNTHEQIEKYLT